MTAGPVSASTFFPLTCIEHLLQTCSLKMPFIFSSLESLEMSMSTIPTVQRQNLIHKEQELFLITARSLGARLPSQSLTAPGQKARHPY